MKSRKILAAVIASACAVSATTAISFAAAEGGLGGDAQDYVKTVKFDKPDGDTYFVPSGANEYGSFNLAGLRVLLDHDTLDLSTIESISFKGAAGAVYTKAHEGTCDEAGNDGHDTGGWANPTDGVVVLKMSDLDLGGWFSIKPVAATEGAEVEITVTFKSAAGDNTSNPTESDTESDTSSKPTESDTESDTSSKPDDSSAADDSSGADESGASGEDSANAGNSGSSGDASNPGTGIALAVVPVVIAGAAIAVVSKKRK